VGTALMAGFNDTLGDAGAFFSSILSNPWILLQGLPFSLAIMSILLAHEMGHYLTCRYYGVSVSLPYFIPVPFAFGTMGAFIRIREMIHNRPVLLEMGIAGPIAGFVALLPIMALGLTWSRIGVVSPGDPRMGDPLILKFFEALVGKLPPPGTDVYLHPVAMAAWIGCLVTTLNLLPIGQLDGGHVTYALFRSRHGAIAIAVLGALIPMGLFVWGGWLVWFLIPLMLGYRHPPTADDVLPLKRRHTVLGIIALAMFILCFTPVPFAAGTQSHPPMKPDGELVLEGFDQRGRQVAARNRNGEEFVETGHLPMKGGGIRHPGRTGEPFAVAGQGQRAMLQERATQPALRAAGDLAAAQREFIARGR
jgi:Zn-dependent protease